MTTLDDLRAALKDDAWLTDAEARVRREPTAAAPLFARADRTLGREPLPDAPDWTCGQAGRAILLAALPAESVVELYQQGDAHERLAVLKALPLLAIGDAGVPLLHDALRTNDTRLVAAALGPYARHLGQAAWRQGVVKCVFMGVPLDVVDGLAERTDDDLLAMLAGLAEERAAAGRPMPADAAALLTRREPR
jgi:hypothetical protein